MDPIAQFEREYQRFMDEMAPFLAGSPERKKTRRDFATPESLKAGERVINASNPREKLTPGRSSVLNVALTVLTDLDDLPTREKYSNKYRRGLVGAHVELHSPDAVEALHGFVEGRGGAWVSSVVVKTKAALRDDFTGIRLRHLEKIEKGGTGFHFCPLGDVGRLLIEVMGSNPETGVWVGRYKGKISSFFPDTITTREELTRLLLSKKSVASYETKGKRKQLSLISDGTNSFYVIDYRRREASILTAFPLFYAKHLHEMGEDIVIHGALKIKKVDLMAYLLSAEKAILHEKIEISISETLHLLRLDGEFGIPLGLGVYVFVKSEEMNYTPRWT
jgi:hypothetical protein